MTGASGEDMSVYDFDGEATELARNALLRKGCENPRRTERSRVTKGDFMNCFSRKTDLHLMESGDELNLEYQTNNQEGITRPNGEENIDSLEANNVGHLLSGDIANVTLNNDDGKPMTNATPDPSGDLQIELISEDDGLSARKFSTLNAMSDASDDEGASEHSDSDTCHNSDDYDNMESEDSEILVMPEFGLLGSITFLMPRLIFSAESIRLEIFNHKTSSDEVNVFQWSISDVETIKTYYLSNVNVAVVILSLKQGFITELETFFRVTGAPSVLEFSINEPSWFEQAHHIVLLSEAYDAIWKPLDVSIYEDILLLCKKISLASQDQHFVRFESIFDQFVFPKGDQDAVTITSRDMELLRPEEYLNDTLIDFYIKYLQTTLSDKQREACHFFNSFLFRKIADVVRFPDMEVVTREAFKRIRWTKKVKLFEKDYIFMPVNYGFHWSLIVICNPGDVIALEDGDHSRTPCILHMDSFSGTHANLKKLIQSYLWEEWRARHPNDEAMFDAACEKFSNMPFISVEVPQQNNYYDCGLFLLHYVEIFLRDAPAKFNLLEAQNISKFLTRDWFLPNEASTLKRIHIRDLIIKLYKELSGNGPAPSYSASHQYCEAGQSDTSTSQDVEYVSEACAANQTCSENVLLLNKVNQVSIGHMDDDNQDLSLCESGRIVAMENFGKALGLVYGENSGIGPDAHSCHEEQFGSFHHNILSHQLKTTLGQVLESDNQSNQEMPSGGGMNHFTLDVFHQFATNDSRQSEKETEYFHVSPATSSGIHLDLFTSQLNPNTHQLLDQQEELSESSSKRVLCTEGSESPNMSPLSESSSHIRQHASCDTRARKRLRGLDDTVDEENKVASEDIEKPTSVMDSKSADELNVLVEPRSVIDIRASHTDEAQVERTIDGKDSEYNLSPKPLIESLQQVKAGKLKAVSCDNDINIACENQNSKPSSTDNLNMQNFATSHCETLVDDLEGPDKDMRDTFIPCQADQQSLDNDNSDAHFASADAFKHSLSIKENAGTDPIQNDIMVADDRGCDDSIGMPIENSTRPANSSGMVTEDKDKVVIVEGDFRSKAENKDVHVVEGELKSKAENKDVHVVEGDLKSKAENKEVNVVVVDSEYPITSENMDKVSTEGRDDEPLPGFLDKTVVTPESKQQLTREGAAECLPCDDFNSPPPELIIPKTRNRKTPSTVANGRSLTGSKGTPLVLDRPRTRSVTKSMDTARPIRENRRRSVSNR